MQIRLGCRLTYELAQPTPMIALLNVHYSRAPDLDRPDHLLSTPPVPMHAYRDEFGNWCTRFVAPAGTFSLTSDAYIRDSGEADSYEPAAWQHAVEELPDDTLVYLLGSRYCDTDILSAEAWRLFENTPMGWGRVQAICDWVHNHIQFGYEYARATRTASEALAEAQGVCRDYTHLAVAFCRCMNIPARYCTGYLGDVGQTPPFSPADFAAWMEVYLGGRWWVFDPRNNTRRRSRILVARGRDAADVPLTQSFGPAELTGFEVWTDQVS
ncbi:transglutaminase-like domain-containing protein [Pseudoroseicyclus sp. H15]